MAMINSQSVFANPARFTKLIPHVESTGAPPAAEAPSVGSTPTEVVSTGSSTEASSTGSITSATAVTSDDVHREWVKLHNHWKTAASRPGAQNTLPVRRTSSTAAQDARSGAISGHNDLFSMMFAGGISRSHEGLAQQQQQQQSPPDQKQRVLFDINYRPPAGMVFRDPRLDGPRPRMAIEGLGEAVANAFSSAMIPLASSERMFQSLLNRSLYDRHTVASRQNGGTSLTALAQPPLPDNCENCPICLDSDRAQPWCQLPCCRNYGHIECTKKCLAQDNRCFICRTVIP